MGVELWNQCAGGRQHIIRSPNFLPLGHWPPATTCPIKPIILIGDARQPVRYRASDAAPRVAGHADRGAHAPRGRQHNSDRPTRWPLRAVLGSRPGPWYLTALPRRRVAMRNDPAVGGVRRGSWGDIGRSRYAKRQTIGKAPRSSHLDRYHRLPCVALALPRPVDRARAAAIYRDLGKALGVTSRMLEALRKAEVLIATDIIRDDAGCLAEIRAALAEARAS